MDLGKNLEDAFDFTKKMSEDAGRWIILIILSIIPIVNFITVGYAAKVIKDTPNSNTPPKIELYADLWIQGLKVIVAAFIYLIIPLIIIGVGAATFIRSMMSAGMFGMGVGRGGLAMLPLAGLGGMLFIVGFIVMFFIDIIAVIGLAHMIKTDKFGKAFAFKEIINIIGKIGWGSYILWLIIIYFICIIYAAIGNIPLIGWLITLVLIPPFIVFLSRSLGLTYSNHKG